MDDALRLLTLQFLEWVGSAPRTYGEAMAAWRTSCPRLPVWEDAVENGLVRMEPLAGAAMADSPVRLTPRGEALAAGAASVHA